MGPGPSCMLILGLFGGFQLAAERQLLAVGFPGRVKARQPAFATPPRAEAGAHFAGSRQRQGVV